MSLTDHGLYKLDSAYKYHAPGTKKQFRGKRIGANSEAEIFDLLRLEYKAPYERTSFDSVVEKGASKPVDLDLNDEDGAQEREHIWID
jgi:hypothetical protein